MCIAAGCCWFKAQGRPTCYKKQIPKTTNYSPQQSGGAINYLLSSVFDPKLLSDYARDLLEDTVSYSWSSWSSQPCAAECNSVGIQGNVS